MPAKLARHGTEAGYKSELKTGKPCQRCSNAHVVYNRQFGKRAKAAGVKHGSHDVLDHLYNQSNSVTGRVPRGRAPGRPSTVPQGEAETDATGSAGSGSDAGRGEADHRGEDRPSLSDRIKGLIIPDQSQEYVESGEAPSYIHEITPDPEPDDSQWSGVGDEEFVINAAGMRKIEDNLGTYLSVVGMTAEMIDPYCGQVLAANFDNIVKRWSKVVAHYPSAAKLFLDSKGGVIFLWIGALQATWPVLYAFFEHHLAGTVEVREGIAYRRTQNGRSPVDATMPPAPDEFNYTVN